MASNNKKGGVLHAGQLFREEYFPTLVYRRDVADAEAFNADLTAKIHAWRERDPTGIVRSNMAALGSWHSALDMNNSPEFADFVQLIDMTMQQIFDDQGYDPAYQASCDNMWANINPRHGYNRTHTHPNVLWSGVYYVQAPTDSGRVYFTDPRPGATMVTPHLADAASQKREGWREVYFEPLAGRLLIFPAWLPHEVFPNLAPLEGEAGERISIAFNYIQKLR